MFLQTNDGDEHCLIHNKRIGKNDFSSLTDDGSKTFTDLKKYCSTANVPPSHT